MGNCNKVFTHDSDSNGSNSMRSDSSSISDIKISNLSPKKIKKIFTHYNILDYNRNIIVGTWDKPDIKNKLGNQCLWIGEKDQIYELIFGLCSHNLVILHYEKNIVLKIEKKINKTNDNFTIVVELKNNTNSINYTSELSNKVISELKKINNNSSDLDLIFNIIQIDV